MVINMNIGGTEKALLNLINEMPKDRYEITVLLLEKRGGFLEAIPDGVRVEYVTEYPATKKMLHHAPHRTILEKIRVGKFIQAFNLTLLYGVAKVKKERSLYYQYVLKDVARSEEHTSELQSRGHLVCRLLLEKKKTIIKIQQ